MGNNKSTFLTNFNLEKQQKDCLIIHDTANNNNPIVTVNSTTSLPVGLNSNNFQINSTTNGFLKRIRNHNKIKKHVVERLNLEDDMMINNKNKIKKNKKMLNSPISKFSINKNKKQTDVSTNTVLDDIAAAATSTIAAEVVGVHTTKYGDSVDSIKLEEIKNEPEYTSINECHSIDIEKKISKQNDESFYESALEVYEFLTNQRDSNKKIKNKNLDYNLYSEVVNHSSTPTTTTTNNNNNTPNSLLLISNAIHFKKYHLQPLSNLINRLKNSKNRNKKTKLPQLPTKAFNPVKEFIYEQAKYANKNNDESDIYFKILDNNNLINKQNDDYQSLPEYEPILTIKQSQLLLLSSSSSSSLSSSVKSLEINQQPPPLPPLPDKKTLNYTSIEPINLNNQVYYSFVSTKG
jgi:hypothetical protein